MFLRGTSSLAQTCILKFQDNRRIIYTERVEQIVWNSCRVFWIFISRRSIWNYESRVGGFLCQWQRRVFENRPWKLPLSRVSVREVTWNGELPVSWATLTKGCEEKKSRPGSNLPPPNIVSEMCWRRWFCPRRGQNGGGVNSGTKTNSIEIPPASIKWHLFERGKFSRSIRSDTPFKGQPPRAGSKLWPTPIPI